MLSLIRPLASPLTFCPPLGGIVGLGTAELAMIIAIFGLIFGCVMGALGMYFDHQRKRLWHETTRLALEKGRPVPVYGQREESPAHEAAELRHHDLRGGLVLIAVGAGLYVFLRAVSNPAVAALGYIPGFIGAALLVHWLFTRGSARKPDSPSRHS
jgi:hypothetical protein